MSAQLKSDLWGLLLLLMLIGMWTVLSGINTDQEGTNDHSTIRVSKVTGG